MPAVKEPSLPAPQAADSIIDIRSQTVEFNLKQDVVNQMNPTDGPRSLPTMLLYDEKGLQLFENITYLDQYYLTNCEIALLEKHAADIAKNIPDRSIVVELGSGNLRKVCLLLNAFERAAKNIDYYALDLDYHELQRTLANVPNFKHVRCHGLHGTYDDGRDWLRQFALSDRHVCVLHLGSSIGNFHRDDAADFLHSFSNVLKSTDSMLIGIDSCCDPDKVYHAYNDREGVTHQFILNALHHANDIFDKQVFDVADWQVIGEYVYDEDGGRHQAFLSPKHETFFDGVPVQAHERLKIEQSLKYSQVGADKLWRMSGFTPFQHWRLGSDYGLHLLKPAPLPFSTIQERYAASSVPSLRDWETLWTAWDTVTKSMLPPQDLQEKPIKLRNACVFYLGHIPTFLDIQLQKMAKLPPTEPANYQSIFERGIDPDVDNPEQCHDHSEVPDEWPPVAEIEAFQARVRARLVKLYEGKISRDVGRAIWVGFEHEVMHLETLLYMMLQSDRTLPPPHTGIPDFAALAEKARVARVPNEWVDIPAKTITLGMNDPEDVPDFKGYYGWDNEKPQRKAQVGGFQARARPITNNEYALYMQEAKIEKPPASWAASDTIGSPTSSHVQGKSVRTVYGLVPLKYALDWPVMASYDELAGCAAWMGGRIPTMEEAKSIYQQVEHQKEKERFTRSKLANNVPAVNAHLVNDGVEETPPLTASAQIDEDGLFVDLSGANVGFRHWMPQPVTGRGSRLAGQGDLGGAWEWTSSPLLEHEGFEPMALYPAYTADFFDGKHNIVLGGSWATHPRVAGRKSFVNWYQTNYPYAWVTARVVKDV